jgi:hypothetical protein
MRLCPLRGDEGCSTPKPQPALSLKLKLLGVYNEVHSVSDLNKQRYLKAG